MKNKKVLSVVLILAVAFICLFLYLFFLSGIEKFDYIPYVLGTSVTLAIWLIINKRVNSQE